MTEQPNRMKNSSDKPIAYLIRDYILEIISDEDRKVLDNWMSANNENKITFTTATDEKTLQEGLTLIHETDIRKKYEEAKMRGRLKFTDSVPVNDHSPVQTIPPGPPRVPFLKQYWWVAAACLILLAGIGMAIFQSSNNNGSDELQDLPPGGAKALLTLHNGEEIIVQNQQDGTLASTGTSEVIKENGRLRYIRRNSQNGEPPKYNTVTTPLTGNYPVVLSDGTRLTLNTGSTVTFPTEFTGKERRIVMSGEVYFEVNPVYAADGTKIPFFVEVKDRNVVVEVVGTKFNINSYNNEPVRTTLDEGSIIISAAGEKKTMTPGQQSEVFDSGIKLVKLDSLYSDAARAWKDDQFDFNKADLRTMMNEIGRWYDITVEYQGRVPDRQFNARFSRNQPLSEVLKVLDKGEVKYKRVKGKKLVIIS